MLAAFAQAEYAQDTIRWNDAEEDIAIEANEDEELEPTDDELDDIEDEGPLDDEDDTLD